MKGLIKVLVGASVVLTLAGCPDISLKGLITQKVGAGGGSPSTIRVLSIADARVATGYTLDGSVMTNVRSKLLNPANFGPSGTVKSTITITDTVAPITTSLLAQYDVCFIGWIPNGTVGPFWGGAELTAMTTWVNSGGVMIVSADDETHDSVLTTFGYGMSTHQIVNNTASPNGPGTTHPVFVGPFGTASTVSMSSFIGTFTGNLAGQLLIGRENAAPNSYVVIEVPFGAGRVLFLADVDMISDTFASAGSGISPANLNDVFLGNIFADEHK